MPPTPAMADDALCLFRVVMTICVFVLFGCNSFSASARQNMESQLQNKVRISDELCR